MKRLLLLILAGMLLAGCISVEVVPVSNSVYANLQAQAEGIRVYNIRVNAYLDPRADIYDPQMKKLGEQLERNAFDLLKWAEMERRKANELLNWTESERERIDNLQKRVAAKRVSFAHFDR